MRATEKQNISAQNIINTNPSLRWDGKFSHYSNGQVLMNVYWDFDKTKTNHKIVLNIDGTINQDNRK